MGESDRRAHANFNKEKWGFWVTAETISKWGRGDSSTENRGPFGALHPRHVHDGSAPPPPCKRLIFMIFYGIFMYKNTVNRKNYIKICVVNFTVSRQKTNKQIKRNKNRNIFFYSVEHKHTTSGPAVSNVRLLKRIKGLSVIVNSKLHFFFKPPHIFFSFFFSFLFFSFLFFFFFQSFTLSYLYNNNTIGNSIFLEIETILCCWELIIAGDN